MSPFLIFFILSVVQCRPHSDDLASRLLDEGSDNNQTTYTDKTPAYTDSPTDADTNTVSDTPTDADAFPKELPRYTNEDETEAPPTRKSSYLVKKQNESAPTDKEGEVVLQSSKDQEIPKAKIDTSLVESKNESVVINGDNPRNASKPLKRAFCKRLFKPPTLPSNIYLGNTHDGDYIPPHLTTTVRPNSFNRGDFIRTNNIPLYNRPLFHKKEDFIHRNDIPIYMRPGFYKGGDSIRPIEFPINSGPDYFSEFLINSRPDSFSGGDSIRPYEFPTNSRPDFYKGGDSIRPHEFPINSRPDFYKGGDSIRPHELPLNSRPDPFSGGDSIRRHEFPTNSRPDFYKGGDSIRPHGLPIKSRPDSFSGGDFIRPNKVPTTLRPDYFSGEGYGKQYGRQPEETYNSYRKSGLDSFNRMKQPHVGLRDNNANTRLRNNVGFGTNYNLARRDNVGLGRYNGISNLKDDLRFGSNYNQANMNNLGINPNKNAAEMNNFGIGTNDYPSCRFGAKSNIGIPNNRSKQAFTSLPIYNMAKQRHNADFGGYNNLMDLINSKRFGSNRNYNGWPIDNISKQAVTNAQRRYYK